MQKFIVGVAMVAFTTFCGYFLAKKYRQRKLFFMQLVEFNERFLSEISYYRRPIKDFTEKFLIEIKDNGCGIGEEEKKKIFMPNFTTKSSGMGVGLSIVYDILETLGGSINFESEIGKGTTFIIEIKK